MAVGVQVFEQRAGDIGQAAGFGERRHFGGHEANTQRHGRILPQRETRIGDAIIMPRMRTLAVYLTLLLLLALSIGAGFIASDWPHWCSCAALVRARLAAAAARRSHWR